MTRTLEAYIVSVLVSPADSLSGESVRVSAVDATLNGFAGDRHATPTQKSSGGTPYYPRGTEVRNSRTITIVSEEELAPIARAMGVPEILPEWLCANILVRGVPDLTHLPPTSTLVFPGGAGIVVYKENNPCPWPGKIMQSHFPGVHGLPEAFPKHAAGLRGLLAWVERPGIIHEGETCSIHIAEQTLYRSR